MDTQSLANKSCVPCQGGQPPLDQDVIIKHLDELKGQWHINDQGHLHRSYKYKDFMGAMNFANKIAALAEKESHHPDIRISWGFCDVEIWTHKINGLTESDFILAAKIDAMS